MQQAYHHYQYAQPASMAPVSQMPVPMATPPQAQQMSLPANHPMGQLLSNAQIMRVNMPANHPIIQLLNQPQPQQSMQMSMTPQSQQPSPSRLQMLNLKRFQKIKEITEKKKKIFAPPPS